MEINIHPILLQCYYKNYESILERIGQFKEFQRRKNQGHPLFQSINQHSLIIKCCPSKPSLYINNCEPLTFINEVTE